MEPNLETAPPREEPIAAPKRNQGYDPLQKHCQGIEADKREAADKRMPESGHALAVAQNAQIDERLKHPNGATCAAHEKGALRLQVRLARILDQVFAQLFVVIQRQRRTVRSGHRDSHYQ